MAAARQTGYRKVAVVGGVAANSRIRRDLEAACQQAGAPCTCPPLKLCGDNGNMIGDQGYYEYLAGTRGGGPQRLRQPGYLFALREGRGVKEFSHVPPACGKPGGKCA